MPIVAQMDCLAAQRDLCIICASWREGGAADVAVLVGLANGEDLPDLLGVGGQATHRVEACISGDRLSVGASPDEGHHLHKD